MKTFFFIFASIALFNFACQTNGSGVNSENKTVNKSENMIPQTNTIKKFDDLEISYKIAAAANRAVNIVYTIKNNGTNDYVVFNQGHTNLKDTGAVYVEEKDGLIEFSQKAFSKPTGVMCPNSLVPIVARGAILKANGELSGQANLENTAQTFTPYDFCIPPKPVGAKITQAKFCLGVAKADGTKIDEKGNVENVNALVAKQTILCSDSINLEK
jgi:hypothetical protein